MTSNLIQATTWWTVYSLHWVFPIFQEDLPIFVQWEGFGMERKTVLIFRAAHYFILQHIFLAKK